MMLWLGMAPAGAMLLADAAPGDAATPGVVVAVAIAIAAVALPLPFIAVALLTRLRVGWKPTAAVAASCAAIAGYILLNAMVRAVLPETSNVFGEDAGQAAVRLGVLIPYTLIVACLIPILAGAPRRGLLAWLGLDRFGLSTLLLGLTVAALLTLPWPVTGALGDSLTSLSLAFQALAHVVPRVLLLWGVVFCLLTSTLSRPSVAALVTILLHSLSTMGDVLPAADWGALGNPITLLPLALLLSELRARRSGIYPLLPVAFCHRVVPLLFADPRDVIVQGIPELQHVLSGTIGLATAAVVGPVLWTGRQLLLRVKDRVRIPAWVWIVASALAAVIACGTWGGLYVFVGKPGFYSDGFLIVLEQQADLSDAHAIADRHACIQYVYETLVETAERTQAPLRAELDDLGVPYRPYYIINMIRVDGHRWLMRRFESRSGVAQVILNPNVREYPGRIPIPYGGDDAPVDDVQSNLAAIHADDAWALGVTGESIVVAGQDTGYDWTHPVLKPHYRGWDGQQANHDYSWHDSWDDTAVPFDDDSHGTHTMGSVLGDDGGRNRTGVAPGAQWIGCRNMRRGFGNPGSYAECMEYFLAPYPHGGDPFVDGDTHFAPHVINNSWGCPDIEGCFSATLEPAVEALRAAGIMMVVSAGNEGPACGTATTPPANYDAAFSVGATTDNGNIVGFSNRGPVDGLIKPDIAAPGDWVRSSVPGGGYGYAGGTSMAGPHVAGVVALLWSAEPALIGDIDATEQLICATAVPKPVEDVCTIEDEVPEGMFVSLVHNPVCACGGTTGVPNNVYGCGFIDAGAAVQKALGE
jgi:hypothetical protein